MRSPTWQGREDIRRAPGSRSHVLLVAETTQLRAGTAAWVRHELAGGSRVLYECPLADIDLPCHWLLAPGGAPSLREAWAEGQLSFLPPAGAAGDRAGRFRCRFDAVERALADGWPAVAMTRESALEEIDDDRAGAEYAGRDRAHDLFAARWPVNTLCQLPRGEEPPGAAWAALTCHHREVVADRWSARTGPERWHLAGTLDAAVAPELGAALHGALLGARGQGPTPDLHLDLARVESIGTACAQVIMMTARWAARHQAMVLHGTPRTVRRVLESVGCAPSVTFGARRR